MTYSNDDIDYLARHPDRPDDYLKLMRIIAERCRDMLDEDYDEPDERHPDDDRPSMEALEFAVDLISESFQVISSDVWEDLQRTYSDMLRVERIEDNDQFGYLNQYGEDPRVDDDV